MIIVGIDEDSSLLPSITPATEEYPIIKETIPILIIGPIT